MKRRGGGKAVGLWGAFVQEKMLRAVEQGGFNGKTDDLQAWRSFIVLPEAAR